jgi:3-oxoacyl-[acyl-carrier-protein] synthase-1
MKRIAVADYTLATALGAGRARTLQALRANASGLRARDFETARLPTWLGVVEGLDAQPLPAPLAAWGCRNHRLAWLALQADDFAASVAAARARHGAERVGVFLGTSTSGILSTEQAFRRRDPATGALPADFDYEHVHSTGALAAFARAALGLAGPSHVISTACSSSAKAYAAAARMMALGVIDAAVVGGVDSLCMTVLYGFHSLELLSPDICRPWDARRRGISLGEGASFALLEREDAAAAPRGWLLGCGETSDGHHMSSPLPDGAGAAAAMRRALDDAGLAPADVGYLNLHGTATVNNDAAEDAAVHAVFGDAGVPCSSTKGATGHTLGAAGGVEAAICLLALEHGLMPGGCMRATPDRALRARYLDAPVDAPLRTAASNSFGFGGSNACLVFGAARAEGGVR